ncbi:bifunctional glutathionylspermidine amidase/glutathionylspermidine synthetase [Citrobacter koseri]|uniref:Bifunctional glutathionylspermidine amidase/glutathionylspermidine synthetase n=1 Tax=Citrobacter koseri TaxID=545 RepID=A0A2X2WJ77_CITKO|nr:bifunctional glutathionylspermidine amidase/glutathionylspermidine synthetase [Citrobacter koseri]
MPTDKVLKDDNLPGAVRHSENPLAAFAPLLAASSPPYESPVVWHFCMDERGLKVYEYNADSASCHTEAGLILERWPKRATPGRGHNPAEGLINELAGAWETQPRASFRPHHAG